MIDWWFNDDLMMIEWWLINWWLIDDWLMIHGMTISQFWLCLVYTCFYCRREKEFTVRNPLPADLKASLEKLDGVMFTVSQKGADQLVYGEWTRSLKPIISYHIISYQKLNSCFFILKYSPSPPENAVFKKNKGPITGKLGKLLNVDDSKQFHLFFVKEGGSTGNVQHLSAPWKLPPWRATWQSPLLL